jgi:hypothetical protein
MGRVQRKEYSVRTVRKGCERPDLMQGNDGYVYVCVQMRGRVTKIFRREGKRRKREREWPV